MKKFDFLIVGQGLAGTMLAFEMLDRGIDFRIVSSPQKSKASLVAAGMINPLVFKRLTKSWMVDELLPFMENRYRQLEYLLNESFYFQKQILKPLSEQETELWKSKKAKFDSYVGDILESSPIEGISSAYAFGLVDGAGYLNLKHFLEKAEAFFLQKKLLVFDDLQIDSSSAKVYSGLSNEATESKVVFCEGYHLQNNPFFSFVKMNPAKGEVLLIHAPNLSEEYILNKKAFVLPVGNGRFKIGSTYEWDDLSERITEKGKESIVERLDALVDVKYQIEDQWAGVRPTIADRRPVLGQHPQFQNLYVFNGLGTKGAMLAPYFAKEMCNLLTNNSYELAEEVRIERFWT